MRTSLLALTLILGTVAGCRRPAPPPPVVEEPEPPAPPAPPLAVGTMRAAFRQNEAEAKRVYIGKRFRLQFRATSTGEAGALFGIVPIPGGGLEYEEAALFLRPDATAPKVGQTVWVEAEVREYTPGVVLPLWLAEGEVVR